jgi:hypothetical protein
VGGKRLSRKRIFKKLSGKCFFCGEAEEEVLDAHRIIPGEEGGKYHNANMICCCSTCHRKCHSGTIKIDRKYNSTMGVMVVHYWYEGVEYWVPENRGHPRAGN